MKVMKRKTFSLLVYGLVLMLVMYNCKKKDEDPLTPDAGKLEELSKITMTPVTLVKPAAVASTEGKVDVSAKATALNADLASIATTGVLPASAVTASAEVTKALSPAEISTMSSLTPAALAAIAKGGALPADVKAVMTKAAADAALSAYFPKVTYPTVGGKEVKGRIGGTVIPEAVEATEGTLVSDECIAAAEAAFQTKKAALDAARLTALIPVTAQYAADIAPIAAAQSACNSPIAANYDAQRASYLTVYNTGDALLQTLGASGVPMRISLLMQYLALVEATYASQSAAVKACSDIAAAQTANANTARDSNAAAVEASYATAIAAARAAQTALVASCHNQGGGL